MLNAVDNFYHDLIKSQTKSFTFDANRPFAVQQQLLRQRYAQLVRLPEKNFTAVPAVEYTKTDDPRFDEIRFTVESEPGLRIPAHMLLPKDLADGEKRPAVICLQGHSTGMHISLGRPKYPGDETTISGGDRDFALQAVAAGYIAIAMEQRGFGELKTGIKCGGICHHLYYESLMAGRTLQGDRIHDVRCMVDALAAFDRVDTDRIAITGNSGGGTTSYHAAVLEERIKAVMPSCSFCTYADSILAMEHCCCNYVPGLAAEMEMADLAVGIAPRPLLIINGREDPIFPLEAANRAFEQVQRIYTAAGAPENCRHLVGPEGHRYYAALAWPNLKDFI